MFKKGDIAEVVVLDISTAKIGEYAHVRVLKVEGKDILISNAKGEQAWVTEQHLELSEN